jgi:spermidine synthase
MRTTRGLTQRVAIHANAKSAMKTPAKRPHAHAHVGSAAPLQASAGRLFAFELYATVFVCGAAVMVIEILGTRVIGPVFGVSLFVWSALLAVTLASLAFGYALGGVLVDRSPSAPVLHAVVIAGGVALGFAPALSHVCLAWAQALGPRFGPLFSASLLFAPSLIALGTVGPIAVRLANDDISSTGRRVGGVYALSTAGSLLGTLFTAFVLVPSFETQQILLGDAALLICVGALPLARRKRPASLGLLIAPWLCAQLPAAPWPADIKLLARAQSLYGLVEVLEDSKREVRFLRADHSIIGAQFTRDHSAGFAFLHLLETLRFMRPRARSLLQIGLGIGSLPTALARYGVVSDVVEIDPNVLRFARDYFQFTTRGQSYVEDARSLLARTTRHYDLIVHDTFTGGSTPEHLLSREVLARIARVLTPGGVLALDFVGFFAGPEAEASHMLMRTLRSVFSNVHAYADSAPEDRTQGVGNVVFFASNAALDFRIPNGTSFENAECEHIARSFSNWEVLQHVPDGALIEDDRNPMTRLQLHAAELHYAAMNSLLAQEVWLH